MKIRIAIVILLFFVFNNTRLLGQNPGNSDSTAKIAPLNSIDSDSDESHNKHSALKSVKPVSENDTDNKTTLKQSLNNLPHVKAVDCKCDSDKNNPEIIYDFASKHFKCDVMKMRYGKGLNFKVINFPRLMYEPQIDYNIITYESNGNNNPFAKKFNLVTLEPTSPKAEDEGKQSENENKEKAKGAIGSLQNKGNKKPDVQRKITNLKELIDSSSKRPDEIIAIADSLKNDIKDAESISLLMTMEKSYMSSIFNGYKNQFDAIVREINKMSMYYAFDINTFNELKRGYVNIDTIKQRINKTFPNIIENRDTDFKNDFKWFSEKVALLNSIKRKFNTTYNSIKDSKLIEGDVEEWKNDINEDYAIISKNKYGEAVIQVQNFIEELINPKSYEINFGKFMAYGDELELNFGNKYRDAIVRNPDGSLLTVLPEPDFNFPKKIGVYDYWALDFSTGIIGSGTMQDRVYNKIDIGNDSVKITENGKPYNTTIGLSAFIHASYVLTPICRIGAEIGAAVNSNNEMNGSYLAGLSFGIKLRKAVVYLNGGFSFASSVVLKEKYSSHLDSNHEVVFQKDFVEENCTENRIKPGFYFGVSFNLLTITINNGNKK